MVPARERLRAGDVGGWQRSRIFWFRQWRDACRGNPPPRPRRCKDRRKRRCREKSRRNAGCGGDRLLSARTRPARCAGESAESCFHQRREQDTCAPGYAAERCRRTIAAVGFDASGQDRTRSTCRGFSCLSNRPRYRAGHSRRTRRYGNRDARCCECRGPRFRAHRLGAIRSGHAPARLFPAADAIPGQLLPFGCVQNARPRVGRVRSQHDGHGTVCKLMTDTQVWPTELRLHKDRKTLTVTFDGGEKFDLPSEYLRVKSPSAEVQGHSAEERKTVPGKRDVEIIEVLPVGNYAVRLVFDDLHSTGIFDWNYLLDLGRNHTAYWQDYLDDLAAKNLTRDPPARRK